jgi:hypothetical protein
MTSSIPKSFLQGRGGQTPFVAGKGKIRVVLGPISEPYPASFLGVPNATIIVC